MAWIVATFGGLIAGIGLVISVSPQILKRLLELFIENQLIYLATGVRLLIGIGFLVAAPGTRLPTVVFALGIVLILAGMGTTLLGVRRTERWAGWWLKQGDVTLRLWGIVTGASVASCSGLGFSPPYSETPRLRGAVGVSTVFARHQPAIPAANEEQRNSTLRSNVNIGRATLWGW